MEAHGSLTENADKSKDLSMGLTNGVASGTVFVSGYKDADPKAFPRPTGPSFVAAGGNLGVQTPGGGANLQATHIPNYGNQLTASTNVNLLTHNDHKVDAHAFTTRNFRKAPVPNYSTHGGGINYAFKDKVGLGASTAYTPIAKMREDNVSGNINLHKTPTTSLDFNVGSRQTTTPHGRGQWKPNAGLSFRMQF